MIVFWLIAAAMTAVAVLLLVPALLGRTRSPEVDRDSVNVAIYQERLAELQRAREDGTLDADQLETARIELERELIGDVTASRGAPVSGRSGMGLPVAVVVGLLVPALSVGLYLDLGNRGGLDPQAAQSAAVAPGPEHPGVGEQQAASIADMVDRLAQRMASEPGNLQGWVMLARSYLAMQRYPEARDAWARAYGLSPDDAEILSRYAEAMALAAGGSLTGKPEELISRALELAPDHANALWLGGMAAFQKGDYPTAVARWEKLSPKLLDQEREMVSEYIAQARSRGGIAPASGPGAAVATQTPAPAASSPATTGGGISTVSVRVSLAPALSGRAAPGDTVFIFARAAEGPRMPLAIVRKTVADLPVEVTLDDSMAMSPTMRLSSFPSVVLGARISRSGNASAQTGDLEGLSAPLARAPGGSVQVVIDRENQGAALPGG